MLTLPDRYQAVQERVAEAAYRAGRRPSDITLVAVSKTWPAATVIEAYQAGMRHFGENRVEELAAKRAEVEAEAALGRDSGIIWHLIGPLQSRKTAVAADTADYFHALDRLKVAERLSARLQANGRSLPVLLEINISGEASKAGFDCTRWENSAEQRKELQQVITAVSELPGLQLRGLMTMAPWEAEPAVIRAVFSRTRRLSQWLQTAVPPFNGSVLSMGMTDDFEIAIAEGATHVRVGRAIFGSNYSQ
jgi:PLP dependent protein